MSEHGPRGIDLDFGSPVEGATSSSFDGDVRSLNDGLAPLPPEFSDDALAELFSKAHKDDLRYVPKWGRWMAWTESKWEEEPDTAIFQRARMICRAATTRATSDQMKVRLASAGTASAVEREARGDHRHAASHEQWDRDPMLLNTPTGIVDLRTGELRPHACGDYMSKITAAGPGGNCDLWRRFLRRVTDENPDLEVFIQRVAGYCLTGRTDEQALFFAWGTGKNGKSVFINTFSKLLGDYAKTAPTSTLTASKTETHPTDLAGLYGARLVTAIETEDGKRWAEARIKAMTGGDPIPCRFMRQDFWTYTPVFKLLIASNHKPTIGTVDEAIRRRIHLIPFTVWISEEERDKQLESKLRAEYPGILQWAIQGCLEWQRVGLNPPAVVSDATREYLDAEDITGRWIDECCVCDKRLSSGSTALFNSYKAWCESVGERPKSQRAFSSTLKDRRFKVEEGRDRNAFVGIGLKADVGANE
jgi:putative DNA primase/helicase